MAQAVLGAVFGKHIVFDLEPVLAPRRHLHLTCHAQAAAQEALLRFDPLVIAANTAPHDAGDMFQESCDQCLDQGRLAQLQLCLGGLEERHVFHHLEHLPQQAASAFDIGMLVRYLGQDLDLGTVGLVFRTMNRSLHPAYRQANGAAAMAAHAPLQFNSSASKNGAPDQ